MVKSIVLFVCLQIVLFAVLTEAICPRCLCTISYRPLCAIQENTGRYRGFNSECVLNCSNKCFRNKYKFLGSGRCGTVRRRIEEEMKRKSTTTSTTSTISTTTSPTTAMAIKNLTTTNPTIKSPLPLNLNRIPN